MDMASPVRVRPSLHRHEEQALATMEDPITFDVWGHLRLGMGKIARALLHEARPDASRLSILQSIAKEPTTPDGLLIVEDIGWGAAEEWRARASEAFERIEVYQSGYGPSRQARMQFCPIHHLYFGGVLGCPVCRGFYVP